MCPTRHRTFSRPGFLLAARRPSCLRPQRKYRPETRLVHAGILRSQFGETSEALFLTQGYVYDNSAQAEARFKGEEPGYQYSRFANPTVAMFEERMAAFEGAEAARATATGMAAVTRRADGPGARPATMSWRRRRCSARASTWSRTSCRATASPRRWSTAPISTQWRERGAAEHQDLLPRNADQSDAGSDRHRRGRQDRARGRRDAGRRQRVRDAAAGRARSRSAPTASSIRRPSTSTARAAASAA